MLIGCYFGIRMITANYIHYVICWLWLVLLVCGSFYLLEWMTVKNFFYVLYCQMFFLSWWTNTRYKPNNFFCDKVCMQIISGVVYLIIPKGSKSKRNLLLRLFMNCTIEGDHIVLINHLFFRCCYVHMEFLSYLDSE